jgi:hypothetical protein
MKTIITASIIAIFLTACSKDGQNIPLHPKLRTGGDVIDK